MTSQREAAWRALQERAHSAHWNERDFYVAGWDARDADVSALLEAAREMASMPLLRGESGVGTTFTVTFKDTGVLDRLDAEAHR